MTGHLIQTLPTAYFPNLAYFYCLLKNKEVTVATNEPFIRQTLRNRCVILNSNGLQNLSIPVERETAMILKTCEVRISYAEDWIKNHLRSIESAYRRSPFYEYYIDSISSIIFKRHEFLVDLNFELLEFLTDKTGLSCVVKMNRDLEITSTIQNDFVNPKTTSDYFLTKPYIQTFGDRFGFQNNLSILDLLFNEGPNSICILDESNLIQ